MAGAHTMQPDHRIAGADLRVHRSALVITLDTTRRKSEGLDEKVVRRRYVFVYKKMYQTINFRHYGHAANCDATLGEENIRVGLLVFAQMRIPDSASPVLLTRMSALGSVWTVFVKNLPFAGAAIS